MQHGITVFAMMCHAICCVIFFRELDNNSITLIAATDFQGVFNLTNLYVHVHSHETGIVTVNVVLGVWPITLFLPSKQEALTQTVH